MSRMKRSPLVMKAEQGFKPKRLSWWSGVVFAVCCLFAYMAVNVMLYAFDHASSNTQWTINGAITVVVIAALIRWAAREAGLSVSEYLCQTIFSRGRTGWW